MKTCGKKKGFKGKVLGVVSKIPEGKTKSYKEVALLVGKPGAYRAVGNILKRNKDKDVPCHRVIRSDGSVGGYNRGKKKKEGILKKEGAF